MMSPDLLNVDKYDQYAMDMFELYRKRKQNLQFNILYSCLVYAEIMQYFILENTNVVSFDKYY